MPVGGDSAEGSGHRGFRSVFVRQFEFDGLARWKDGGGKEAEDEAGGETHGGGELGSNRMPWDNFAARQSRVIAGVWIPTEMAHFCAVPEPGQECSGSLIAFFADAEIIPTPPRRGGRGSRWP